MREMTVHLTAYTPASRLTKTDTAVFRKVTAIGFENEFCIIRQKDKVTHIPVSRIINICQTWDDTGE